MAAGDFKTAATLGAFLASGQVSAASTDTTAYTVPASSQVKLATAVLCNTSTTTACVVSVSVLPSGATVDGTHRVLSGYSLAAGDSTKLTELEGSLLPSGAFISINASVAAVLDFTITGAVSA